jgi:hypothetical protein
MHLWRKKCTIVSLKNLSPKNGLMVEHLLQKGWHEFLQRGPQIKPWWVSYFELTFLELQWHKLSYNECCYRQVHWYKPWNCKSGVLTLKVPKHWHSCRWISKCSRWLIQKVEGNPEQAHLNGKEIYHYISFDFSNPCCNRFAEVGRWDHGFTIPRMLACQARCDWNVYAFDKMGIFVYISQLELDEHRCMYDNSLSTFSTC